MYDIFEIIRDYILSAMATAVVNWLIEYIPPIDLSVDAKSFDVIFASSNIIHLKEGVIVMLDNPSNYLFNNYGKYYHYCNIYNELSKETTNLEEKLDLLKAVLESVPIMTDPTLKTLQEWLDEVVKGGYIRTNRQSCLMWDISKLMKYLPNYFPNDYNKN